MQQRKLNFTVLSIFDAVWNRHQHNFENNASMCALLLMNLKESQVLVKSYFNGYKHLNMFKKCNQKVFIFVWKWWNRFLKCNNRMYFYPCVGWHDRYMYHGHMSRKYHFTWSLMSDTVWKRHCYKAWEQGLQLYTHLDDS